MMSDKYIVMAQKSETSLVSHSPSLDLAFLFLAKVKQVIHKDINIALPLLPLRPLQHLTVSECKISETFLCSILGAGHQDFSLPTPLSLCRFSPFTLHYTSLPTFHPARLAFYSIHIRWGLRDHVLRP